MREIKFRAWDKKRKMMFHFELFEQPPTELGQPLYLDDLVLMQYTGLKNKKGKEIYEGDVVKEDFYISRFIEEPLFTRDKDGKPIMQEMKVKSFSSNDPIMDGKWETEKQEEIFEIKSLRQIYTYLRDYEDRFSEEKDIEKWRKGNCLKVIGNIYENPGLLKWSK